MKTDFVPVRWWQAIDFIRLNLRLMQGHDPVADRILARPWAWSSLQAYAYLLITFFRSDSFFLFVAGERAGLVSVARQADLIFIFGLGLLANFQRHGLGKQAADFIEDLAKRHQCRALVAAMSAHNEPIHRLVELYGGRLLGLATTKLTLAPLDVSASSTAEIEVQPLGKAEAQPAWRRWRLYEVAQVAGPDAVDIAARLLKWESLPRGKYLALHHNGQEIGFAFARRQRRTGELHTGLFPTATFWPAPQTTDLLITIARYLGAPVHKLTLTQTHANFLTVSASFNFERHLKKERHVAFKQL